VNKLFPHLHDEIFIFFHNSFTKGQHGNPVSFDVSKKFVTFGVKESYKLLQFKHFIGMSRKTRVQKLEQIF
jgi:hypothetical protein